MKTSEDEFFATMFTPDGNRIVTVSTRRAVRLWNADTGDQLGTIQGWTRGRYDDGFYAYATVSPAGSIVAAAAPTGWLRFWRVFPTTQELIDDVKGLAPRCLTRDQLEKAFLDREPPAWCIEREKWPYQTPAWKQWLADKAAGKEVEMPAE